MRTSTHRSALLATISIALLTLGLRTEPVKADAGANAGTSPAPLVTAPGSYGGGSYGDASGDASASASVPIRFAASTMAGVAALGAALIA